MAIAKKQGSIVKGQDVARWVTFSSFWGFVFYLLSFAGIFVGNKRDTLRVHTKTALVGLGVHLGVFVTLGSSFSAVASLVRGKSTTQQARDQIGDRKLNDPKAIIGSALGGAVGSVVPFTMVMLSLRAAEEITNDHVFGRGAAISWPQAVSATAFLSGLTALAVTRIAGWVARDARATK